MKGLSDYDSFNHGEFLANPEPEPMFANTGEDPIVGLPPDLEISPMTSGVEVANGRSWQTEQPSIAVLDEANDRVKDYIQEITIANCDTGENPHTILDKPLAMESFIPGQSPFDGNSHGTHVGGICGSNDRRYSRFVGAKRIVAKVLSNQGGGSSTGIERGIRWATQWRGDGGREVHCINLSLGGGSRHGGTVNACKAAAAQGIVVGAAAGNSGTRGMGYPAKDPAISGIANRRQDGSIASSSSRGQVLIAAAGTNILSASNQSRTGLVFMTGTSMACPDWINMMSAVQALHLASGKPRWRDNEQVFALMKEYSIDAGSPGYDTSFGYGLFDYERLIFDISRFGKKLFIKAL